nr:septum site-determining protein MinC [Ardenticatena sp.]
MSIPIKGERDGLVLALDVLYNEATSLDETIAALQTYLEQHGSFFRGGQVILETGEHAFEHAFLQRVIETLQAHALHPIALRGHHPDTRAAAHALGLELPFVPTHARDTIIASEEGTPALLIRRTLRSGQRVAYEGSVVVWGDVNAGAEIVAGGDVFVWGTLRGLVHAGAFGDETAVVVALRLEPTQLRIGGLIGRAPDDQPRPRWHFWKRQRPQPEIARAVDGAIVVEALSLGR